MVRKRVAPRERDRRRKAAVTAGAGDGGVAPVVAPTKPELSAAVQPSGGVGLLVALREDVLRLADVTGAVGRAATVLAAEVGRLLVYKRGEVGE